jgi:serine/threonine protein kinase
MTIAHGDTQADRDEHEEFDTSETPMEPVQNEHGPKTTTKTLPQVTEKETTPPPWETPSTRNGVIPSDSKDLNNHSTINYSVSDIAKLLNSFATFAQIPLGSHKEEEHVKRLQNVRSLFQAYNQSSEHIARDSNGVKPPMEANHEVAGEVATERKRLVNKYGWYSEHLVRDTPDQELLEVCNTLGQGSLGIVEEVRRKDTQLPTLVRKRIIVPFRRRQTILQIIQDEAKILKSLMHPHIVKFVGSYEERYRNKHFYCLLMSPVGDNELRDFLEIYSEQKSRSRQRIKWEKWLCNWFLCLASALKYMHERGIRHQDIKPSNIIHRGARIFFTDFSSSAAFDVGHTTSTENPSRSSPMYAAPEITNRSSDVGGLVRHGRSSDIFALGCVFCDMLNAWKGRSCAEFHDYLSSGVDGTKSKDHPARLVLYSLKVPLIRKRFSTAPLFDQFILPMLAIDRLERPTAAQTLLTIRSLPQWRGFQCSCIMLQLKRKPLLLSADYTSDSDISTTSDDSFILKRKKAIRHVRKEPDVLRDVYSSEERESDSDSESSSDSSNSEGEGLELKRSRRRNLTKKKKKKQQKKGKATKRSQARSDSEESDTSTDSERHFKKKTKQRKKSMGSKHAYESSDDEESGTSTDRERRLKKKMQMKKTKQVGDSSDSDESEPCWVEEEARKERRELAKLAATGAKGKHQ